MARYYYSSIHTAWIKQCSCCKEITVGTTNRLESLDIFLTVFAPSNGAAGTADDMQSRCWLCNQSKRRALGVTQAWLLETWKSQGGKCDICKTDIEIARNATLDKQANVDHDEESNTIRGLLCGPCNRGIGHFLHKPDILREAADYCEFHAIEIKKSA